MKPIMNEREATIAVLDEVRGLQALGRIPDQVIKFKTIERHFLKGIMSHYLIIVSVGSKTYQAHVNAESGKVFIGGGN